MTPFQVDGPSAGSKPLRLWMILFTLSWVPILIGLVSRMRVVLDRQWWEGVYEVTPSGGWLRIYWFVTIPLVGLGLLAAALLLLARRPVARLVATACLVAAVTASCGELLLMAILHFNVTAAL